MPSYNDYAKYMTDAQFLQSTIRFLQIRGWGKRRLFNGYNGSYCLVGALGAVQGYDQGVMGYDVHIPKALADAIPHHQGLSSDNPNQRAAIVVEFNDHYAKNKCGAINKLCEAVNLAEERGE